MTRPTGRRIVVTATVAAIVMQAVGLGLYERPGFEPSIFQIVVLGVSISAFGLLVLWYRPENRVGRLAAVIGLLAGTETVAGGVLRLSVSTVGPVESAAYVWAWLTFNLQIGWVLILLWFPDGHFHRAASRWFFVGAALIAALDSVGGFLFAPAGTLPAVVPFTVSTALRGPIAAAVWPPGLGALDAVAQLLPIGALIALVDRYRLAPQLTRQQIKWFAAPAVLVVLGGLVIAPLGNEPPPVGPIVAGLSLLVLPLPLAGAAVAIFRRRLWEIDLVISRAVAYGLLWGGLSAVFVAGAVVVGAFVIGAVAQIPIAVMVALIASVVLQPLRRRLERRVTRFVFGKRPRGYAALAELAGAPRPNGGIGELAGDLVETTVEALSVPWASVWIYVETDGTGSLRPVRGSGAGLLDAVILSPAARDALKQLGAPRSWQDLSDDLRSEIAPGMPEVAAAIVPLVAGGELIGLIACGERVHEPLERSDLELLALVGREASLLLRNVRLEAELRGRLAELQRQADELDESRRRLVTAQDEERRKIERDLHDGVQQQLVALTARLRQASMASPAKAYLMLRDLPADAEATVFALQELGRGIYPSVLADQGLAAALTAHGRRMPMDVQVEVEPPLSGRRFASEIEAALYFVGLEAMANAQKHASGARLTIALRVGSYGRRLSLEVHDDVRGFDTAQATPGTGLQNMRDRIGAERGSLIIESREGAGTWVRAEVPLAAEMVPLSERAASREER